MKKIFIALVLINSCATHCLAIPSNFIHKPKLIFEANFATQFGSGLNGSPCHTFLFSRPFKKYTHHLRTSRATQALTFVALVGVAYLGYKAVKKYYGTDVLGNTTENVNQNRPEETPVDQKMLQIKSFIGTISTKIFSQKTIDRTLEKIAQSSKDFDTITFDMSDDLKKCLSQEQQSRSAVRALGQNCTVRMFLYSLKANMAGEEVIEMLDGFETALEVLVSAWTQPVC